MRRDPRRKHPPITHPFNHARHKRRAVELAHLARHADVGVDKRLVVDDHVLVGGVRVGALLETVGLAAEEVGPEVDLDEVQEGNDGEGASLGAGWFSREEEVEEFEADGVALEVEAK